MSICSHSYLSVDHAVFLNILVPFRRDIIKRKENFFYPGTDSFKTRNMNEPSADYTDTDVSASSSGASFFAGRGERLVLNHKGSWEGYRRQGGARFLLPAFLCAQIFIGRETCGYEAADICCRC